MTVTEREVRVCQPMRKSTLISYKILKMSTYPIGCCRSYHCERSEPRLPHALDAGWSGRCTPSLRTHTPILVVALDLNIDSHALKYVTHVTHDITWHTSCRCRFAEGPVVRADNTLGWRNVPSHELCKAWHSICPSTDSAVGARWAHARWPMRIVLGIDTGGEHLHGVDRA